MRISVALFLFAVWTSTFSWASPRPSDFCRCENYLLKVSSLLPDYGQGAPKRVFGVGSLLASDGDPQRYFVLTVGHVASGTALRVETQGGQSLPIQRIFQHPTEDLTVLELDPYIARKYGKILGLIHSSGIETVFYKSAWGHDGVPFWLVSGGLTNSFPAISLQSISHSGLDPQSVFLVLPPWMEVPQVDYDENLIRHFQKKDSSSEPVRVYNRNFQSFPQGFSGSPVVYTSADSDFRVKDHFQLMGILTTSKPGSDGGSSFLEASEINFFFQLILKGLSPSATKSVVYWFLVDGTFVRSSSLILEAFLIQGPVGNGVVVEGRENFNDYLKTKNDFNEEIKKQMLTPRDLELVMKTVRGTKSQLESIRSESSIQRDTNLDSVRLRIK